MLERSYHYTPAIKTPKYLVVIHLHDIDSEDEKEEYPCQKTIVRQRQH